uniref:ATP synthase subunit a n=1 Tax=Nymphon unguiculatum-charcoti complex sp. SEM-1997 TaxID=61899 RepID=E0XLH0_9CHEL|nr:ATP synthase F0 subunit 6 [Nymphon unguiculatum-charcoti complex sp. SEM-1997]
MMDLFSSLSTNMSMISFPLKWLSILFVVFLIPYKFWSIPSRMESLMLMLVKMIPVKLTYLIPMMITIMMMNWMSLTPYLFSPSPHGLFVFMLAFPLWLSTEILRTKSNLSKRISEMLPSRTPMFLIPLMIPVEMVSLLIRPFTLTLRLSINIMAGSLITTLTTIGTYMCFPLIVPQLFLHTLELGVSMIQAYVFVSLINLYKKS